MLKHREKKMKLEIENEPSKEKIALLSFRKSDCGDFVSIKINNVSILLVSNRGIVVANPLQSNEIGVLSDLGFSITDNRIMITTAGGSLLTTRK
jgi:hypothetical protein